MKLNRNYITPFISLIFLVLSLSGILMIFHLFDGYTEVVHELMGLGFVAFAIFHIIINWGGLKKHFGKKVFIPAALAVLVLSTTFIVLERMDIPVDQVLMDKLVKAPITDTFKVLDVDYAEASKKLKKRDILIGDAKTLEEIWIKNDTDPEEVIDLIME